MARVIFLQRMWYEYGGPEVISANLKKHGHYVDLFIGRDSEAFIDKIQEGDIVAFSIMTGEHHWALKTASGIKKEKNVLAVFGGPHPTFFPEIINHPACDVACRGEGEFAMVDLADAYEKGEDYTNILNLSVKVKGSIKQNEVRPLVESLDKLPFSDRDIYYNKYAIIKNSPLKPFMASRGCLFSCAFCFNEKLRMIYSAKGEYLRFYSPKRLIDEVKYVRDKYGLKSIYFTDDLFVFSQKWLEEFIRLYKKEVKKPFVCSAHVNTLNEEVIKLLKDAGCHAVSFGIETGNEKMRNELLNKYISNSQIEKIAGLFKKYRLKFITFNTIGLPGETVQDALETIGLNIKIGADYPRCSFLTPYPGTRIAERYKDKIISKDIQSLDQQTEISFKVPQHRELYNLHYFFQTAVLFPRSLWFIKRLIVLPPNILFRFWWAVIYFIIFVKSEARGMTQALVSGFRTFRVKYACKYF